MGFGLHTAIGRRRPAAATGGNSRVHAITCETSSNHGRSRRAVEAGISRTFYAYVRWPPGPGQNLQWRSLKPDWRRRLTRSPPCLAQPLVPSWRRSSRPWAGRSTDIMIRIECYAVCTLRFLFMARITWCGPLESLNYYSCDMIERMLWGNPFCGVVPSLRLWLYDVSESVTVSAVPACGLCA